MQEIKDIQEEKKVVLDSVASRMGNKTIELQNISKSYGARKLIDDYSYIFLKNDRIGIIGPNGCGKTTLLKIINGIVKPDNGTIEIGQTIRIGYFSQENEYMDASMKVIDYVKEVGEYVTTSDGKITASQMLERFLFDGAMQWSKIEKLSGGEKRRLYLMRVLMSAPNVLILDEPTNDLDIQTLTILEDYLDHFDGIIITVSHDRYFLDKVSNRILEISHGKMYSYDSNYSRFLELKAEREEMELASERKRQSILRMELEWAKRGCRARSTKQRARLDRLEVLKNGTAPTADAVVEMDAVETRMGKKTIEFHNVSKAFGDKTLMKDFEYIFLRNQSVGIIGPNGCGKSTMLRMITGEVLPDAGTIEIGDTIRIGYLAQEEPDMDTNQRVIDYVKDIAEYVQTRDGRISASQMLERFLFTPDMQYTPISKLSGGEKRRLYLLSVLVSGANVLILDEPSNNVDIPTLTVLEDFLNTFVGIVITVSHDRYFLDNVVDRIFEFDGNGNLLQYEGGYTDYLEAKERRFGGSAEETAKAAPSKTSADEPAKSKNNDWKQNRPTRLKFTFKEQREYETIDDDIAVLEEKIASLDDQMLKNATNSAKLAELMAEKEKTEAALEEKTERWVYLTDLAEQIEAQNQK
jgi:ATP-binding cassette subfamily F protein uup